MPTRSALLAAIAPTAGVYTNAFIVPNGFTYLVKSIIVTSRAGAADTIEVPLNDGGAITVDLYIQQVLAAFARLEWNGWVALAPGGRLQVYSLNGYCMFWVSGAKLPGVA